MADLELAIGFPWQPADRAAYLAMFGELPPPTPGSAPRPCADCGMDLEVGPFVGAALAAAPSLVLVCLLCAVDRCGPDRIATPRH